MKIALYYRHIAPADRPALATLTEILQARNVEYCTVHDGESVDGCDFLFSIGGDGTLLSSVQFIHSSRHEAFPPILGINFGHLGFLTSCGKDNLYGVVDEILTGRFSLEERTLLKIIGSTEPEYALNEVFVHRGDSMSLLRTQVYVNNEFVATYAGDGVIVATPTGSTAYSLSCGGPILTPNSKGFVITPISAHTLTLRPIIVPDTATIRLLVKPTGSTHSTSEGHPFTFGTDSIRTPLHSDFELCLTRAPFSIRLVRTNTQSFFSAIREKLSWGTEIRP